MLRIFSILAVIFVAFSVDVANAKNTTSPDISHCTNGDGTVIDENCMREVTHAMIEKLRGKPRPSWCHIDARQSQLDFMRDLEVIETGTSQEARAERLRDLQEMVHIRVCHGLKSR